MKVLINVPDLTLDGGVANHYKGLEPFWQGDITYNRTGRFGIFPGILTLPFDIFIFLFRCLKQDYDVVVLNPSLQRNALFRDAIFILLTHFFFRARIIAFFHGWDRSAENLIFHKGSILYPIYFRVDEFFVLAKAFKVKLEKVFINSKVSLETTKVDDRLLNGHNVDKFPLQQRLLFLARIEENKGIFVALKAFQIVSKRYPDIVFDIVGDGSALQKAMKFVEDERIKNIRFMGRCNREEVAQNLRAASIYLLPTFHGEGMPTSILEAMAFGLVIITAPWVELLISLKTELCKKQWNL